MGIYISWGDYMNKGSLKAIDIQFYTLFFSLASIVISLILTYNQKLIKEDKKTLLSDKASYNLSLFNRVLILSIALIFLYVNYKDYKTSNNNKQKKKSTLQIDASLLTIIAASISLYVVYNSKPEAITNIQNPIV
jgi:uncharacterized membrane protein